MDYKKDKRVVLTLDAGGTNFVFAATKGGEEIIEPIILPAHANDLDKSLANIVSGFQQAIDNLKEAPVAISFAFPGPADYPNGIIDNVGNLPAYGGGVALGDFLKDKFNMPVYINNDGDLFVYGEAMAGLLPKVNQMLEDAGSPKRFKILFGITLGTGFGAGIVRNGELFIGDNSAAAEIWITRNKVRPEAFAEEGASIRAVQNSYAKNANIDVNQDTTPKEIFEIATGQQEGNKAAAIEAFRELGEVVGDALANALTLIDGLVVIGGGLTGAHSCFMPAIIAEMNGTISSYSGEKLPRIVQKTFNLEEEDQRAQFAKGDVSEIQVPGSDRKMLHDPMKRLGVGVSVLGTSRAVSIGAYCFALNALNKS